MQIGYPRRFDPAFRAVRAAVAAGDLGRVHTIRSTTLDPAPPPRAYLAGSGGLFRDCTVHDLDAVRWVTGREVVELYATGFDRADPVFAELGDVDSAALVLTMDDGSLGLISNSRCNARGYDVRLEVHGATDSVAAGLDDGVPLRPAGPGALVPTGPPHAFFMDRLAAAFRAELAAFTDVVAGRSRRRAPSTTHWRPRSSPRPPSSPCASTAPSAWRRSAEAWGQPPTACTGGRHSTESPAAGEVTHAWCDRRCVRPGLQNSVTDQRAMTS